MILAAGLGTRLQPLTYTIPKPMMPLCNRPLIAWLIDSLVDAGVRDIVVNLHHLPEAIERSLPPLFPDVHFEFSYEPEILGTGGGVRKIRALLQGEEDFFLLNGDTFQQPRYDELRRQRRERDALAALTLRHPPEGDRYTPVWHEDGLVTGFGSGRGEALMFSGSHCISRRIFRLFPERDAFGIVQEIYQPLLQQEPIAAVIDDGPWFDIGTPRRYLAASRALCGDQIVGARSVVEGEVRDSVIWDDCFIARGVALDSCIVAHGVEMRAPMRLRNALICRDDPAIPRDSAQRLEGGLVFVSI